jgi:hypothetical protein
VWNFPLVVLCSKSFEVGAFQISDYQNRDSPSVIKRKRGCVPPSGRLLGGDSEGTVPLHGQFQP